MATNRLQGAIESIRKTSIEIVEIARRLSDQELRWKPAENVWSVKEILCHVEESISYWPGELESVVREPGSKWGRGLSDEARLTAVSRAPERAIGDILKGIEKATQKAVDALAQLRDEDLRIESPSHNPRFGTKPMAFIVDHMLIEHLEKHLGQIQRNITQFSDAGAAP